MLFVDDQLWLATDQGLIVEGKHWTVQDGLLSDDVRSLMLDASGHLWVATASGISIFDRKETWYPLTGKNGLPYEDVRGIVTGLHGERWIATGIGAACYANGRWEYYAGKRWLPSDEVTAIAVGPERCRQDACAPGEGEAWIGTNEGISRIEKRPYDLEMKAEYFEERIAARHNRHGLVASCHLETPGDVNSFVHHASASISGSYPSRRASRHEMERGSLSVGRWK
jgi:ligand-binding sensor domain-containing protein